MFVDQVTLWDFRAIRGASVDLVHPMSEGAQRRELPNINILVGTNGGGKSTVLMGIAAAVLTGWDSDSAAEDGLTTATEDSARSWPRIGGSGDCAVHVTARFPARGARRMPDSGVLGFTIDRGSRRVAPVSLLPTYAFDAPPPIFGYGAARYTSPLANETPLSTESPWVQARSLFSPASDLTAPEQWLRAALDQRKDVGEVLRVLMPPDTSTQGRVRDARLMVTSHGIDVPRTALSDGVQTYLAWVFDLLYWLHQRADDVREVAATVLIDEVDQRMNPAWRQTLLSRLSGALPEVQFVCTAHSPLVAAACRPENLTLLQEDRDTDQPGVMQPVKLREDLFGRTADAVLTSSYFGLTSPRIGDFQERLRELAAGAATSDEPALEFIRSLTRAGVGEVGRPARPTRERPRRLQGRRE